MRLSPLTAAPPLPDPGRVSGALAALAGTLVRSDNHRNKLAEKSQAKANAHQNAGLPEEPAGREASVAPWPVLVHKDQ